MSLLNLQQKALPQMVANISVSESRITCISAISAPPTTAPLAAGHTSMSILPDISVNSISSSSSSDHVTLSPASSFDIRSMHSDKDDDLMFLDGDLELSTSSMTTSIQNQSLTVDSLVRVRSNSAPPIPDPVLEDKIRTRIPSPATGQQTLSAQSSATDSSESSKKVWPALTLRPSSLELGRAREECLHSMWLGTEGGQIHVYRVGDNIRSRSNRKTVEMESAVCCIR